MLLSSGNSLGLSQTAITSGHLETLPSCEGGLDRVSSFDPHPLINNSMFTAVVIKLDS